MAGRGCAPAKTGADEREHACGPYRRDPSLEVAAPPCLDQFVERPNVVLAPHIASASVETRKKMSMVAAENAIAALAHNELARASSLFQTLANRDPHTYQPYIGLSDVEIRRGDYAAAG